MELSPIARAKLEQAGELSPEEKEKMKLNEEITSILTEFFTQKLDNEGLWMKLKEKKEAGKEPLLPEIQMRLLHTLTLGSGDFDFDRNTSAIMSIETLKSPNHYAEIEAGIKKMKELRQKYIKEKDEMFDFMKQQIGEQVRMAAQQVARQAKNQNVAVDIEGSIEASVRNSNQWRQFAIKHESNYGQQFEALMTRLSKLF